MNLVELYDALKEANVSQQTATAAVKAVETSLDEPWKRRIERHIAEIRGRLSLLTLMCGVILTLMVMAFVRIMFG